MKAAARRTWHPRTVPQHEWKACIEWMCVLCDLLQDHGVEALVTQTSSLWVKIEYTDMNGVKNRTYAGVYGRARRAEVRLWLREHKFWDEPTDTLLFSPGDQS